MRRIDQGAGVFFLLFGALVAWQSLALEYHHEFGPGPGFLPFWLGVLFMLLGPLLFVEATRSSEAGAVPWPSLAGPRRVLTYAAVFFVCVSLFSVLGFLLSVTLFLLVTTKFLEGERWITSLVVSGGACLGLYLLFVVWLQVVLPTGPLGF